MKRAVLCCLVAFASPALAWGLEKDEILVVYNKSFEGSKELADYYVARRGIPSEHVLALQTDRREDISRKAYDDTIQAPIRAWLDEAARGKKIKAILLMRGVPLDVGRIDDPDTRHAMEDANRVLGPVAQEKKKLVEEQQRLREEAKKEPAKAAQIEKQVQELDAKIAEVDVRLKPLQEAQKKARDAYEKVTGQTNASVDSELAVMYMMNQSFKRWVPNLLNYRTWQLPDRDKLPRTYMVCRLDGATDEVVKRIINDSMETEEKGLEGVAYFDARGMHIPPTGKIDPYAAYDELVRRAAGMVEKTGMKTVLDDQKALFTPDSCPDAALYCGWYSLAKYVPAFRWVKGSVGFHVASGEATTLRGDRQVWCKRMIDDGIAATFGPVAEPYLSSFPDPAPFFAFLLTGRYTVLEAFYYTKPMNSWMLTLIADPLYTPFRKNPKMSIPELREALKPRPLREAPEEPEDQKPEGDENKDEAQP